MARSKNQIWFFDLEKIERDSDTPLNRTELRVRERLAYDPRDQLDLKITLANAVQQLPAQQRRVMELLAQGYTEREIARRLKLSRGNVHDYFTLAREKLKKILRP